MEKLIVLGTDRQKLYTAEGKRYYSGNLYVPNDLDVLVLSEADLKIKEGIRLNG